MIDCLQAVGDDGAVDAVRMEQYQAALTIQKHIRGHQARGQVREGGREGGAR